jgi:hypothetical protein
VEGDLTGDLRLAMNQKRDNFVESTFMKLPLSFALLAGLLFSSCDTEEPPPRMHHQTARYPAEPQPPGPPQVQPFNPNGAERPDVATTEPLATPKNLPGSINQESAARGRSNASAIVPQLCTKAGHRRGIRDADLRAPRIIAIGRLTEICH